MPLTGLASVLVATYLFFKIRPCDLKGFLSLILSLILSRIKQGKLPDVSL